MTFYFQSLCSAAIAAVALMSSSVGALRPASAADTLTIGSVAPPLDVEHWVQTGDGKFKPVTKFETGKVYVVEFWATWCGPCIMSMPHLAELQSQYADKGVQIISISDEDLKTVEDFLETNVRGEQDEDKTYRELTKVYCLTTDPDESSSESYMRAAGQNGIPTSFVVGKDSKIEWIGHPMELDLVLEKVVADEWDRDAFAAEFKAEQEAQIAQQQIFELLNAKKFDEALSKIDAILKGSDNTEMRMMKLQILLRTEKVDAAQTLLVEMYGKLKDDPVMVNMLAWNVYEMTSNMGTLKEGLITPSIAATEAAVAKADEEIKGSLLDTLAHYLFAKGDLAKAIEVETQALAAASAQDREFIENFLNELKEAKKKKDEAK